MEKLTFFPWTLAIVFLLLVYDSDDDEDVEGPAPSTGDSQHRPPPIIGYGTVGRLDFERGRASLVQGGERQPCCRAREPLCIIAFDGHVQVVVAGPTWGGEQADDPDDLLRCRSP